MLKKKLSKKFFALLLVAVCLVVGSLSFASMEWDYMVELSNALSKTKTALGRKALECYGSTMVDGQLGAGVWVLLQEEDENDDWITVTGWSAFGSEIAQVCEVYPVGTGTYQLQVYHTAYAEDDTTFSNPLEGQYSYSVQQTY